MSAPVLAIDGLRVAYASERGWTRVVDDVGFAIAEGEIFGLAGESGSGKSTVAHAVLRILPPPAVITGGHVHVCGRDVLELDDEQVRALRWREVSLVPQAAMNALDPVATIGAQLVELLTVRGGLRRPAALDRAGELLALVGIERSRLRAHPHELSGGMRQRVAIAMALALEPVLVIMDEPTTALDTVVQRELLEHVDALRRELGFAILFISHDLSLMLELCDRVGILQAGRLVEVADAADVLARPAHAYTAALVDALGGGRT